MEVGAARMSPLVRSLVLLCVLVIQVTPQEDGAIETLDLAEEAFDDQYLGCRNATGVRLQEDNILETEKANNKWFRRAWDDAEQLWTQKIKNKTELSLPEGFMDHHGVALVAYTGFIRKYFNKALKSAGKSHGNYMNKFHFKSLHYYLTTALQLLSDDRKNMSSESYHKSEVLYKAPVGTTQVRFGSFFHTSLDKAKETSADEDEDEEGHQGNGTLITVRSCFGVLVEKFSQFPDEKEVLVPGYEVFTVSSLGEDDQLLLVTTGKNCSNFNCAYIRGEKSKLSVEQCINSGDVSHCCTTDYRLHSAASPGRMYSRVITGLLAALIPVLVTLM